MNFLRIFQNKNLEKMLFFKKASFNILKLVLLIALFYSNKNVCSTAHSKIVRKINITNVRFGTIWNRIGKRFEENKSLEEKIFNLKSLIKYLDDSTYNDNRI